MEKLKEIGLNFLGLAVLFGIPFALMCSLAEYVARNHLSPMWYFVPTILTILLFVAIVMSVEDEEETN